MDRYLYGFLASDLDGFLADLHGFPAVRCEIPRWVFLFDALDVHVVVVHKAGSKPPCQIPVVPHHEIRHPRKTGSKRIPIRGGKMHEEKGIRNGEGLMGIRGQHRRARGAVASHHGPVVAARNRYARHKQPGNHRIQPEKRLPQGFNKLFILFGQPSHVAAPAVRTVEAHQFGQVDLLYPRAVLEPACKAVSGGHVISCEATRFGAGLPELSGNVGQFINVGVEAGKIGIHDPIALGIGYSHP